jgi:serine/threonine protein kinase
MEKQKEKVVVELKEVCSICGKKKTDSVLGSMTSWIFQDRKCACTSDPEVSNRQLRPARNKTAIPQRPTKSSREHNPDLGPVLGERFEIIEKLGEGGMGTVYKVKDKKINVTLAIKILHEELARDQANVQRFEQEIKASINMTHPNLLAVYEQGVTPSGAPYLVMDYVDGQSLDHLIHSELFLHPQRVLDIFIQIAEALEHAHNKGVIHRDIKPSNIIISKTPESHDQVKLVDFGIAKILPVAGIDVQNLTQTGDIFGSPLYMSPEQCRGERLDPRSDLYSLGCVMYETLTGLTPFESENAVKTIVGHLNKQPDPIGKELCVSKDLEDVMLMCLEKDPANRFQSAHQLIKDLELISAGKSPKARAEFNRKVRRQKMQKSAIKFSAFVASLVLLVVIIFYSLPDQPWRDMADQATQLSTVGSSHFGEAEQLYKKAMDSAVKHNAPSADIERISYELARLYYAWPRKEQAAKYFEKAITASETHRPDLMTATYYDYLCMLNNEWNKPQAAVEQGEKALAIRNVYIKQYPILVANTQLHLSNSYRLLKEYEKSEAAAREVISILSKVHPDNNDPELAQAYIALDSAIFNELAANHQAGIIAPDKEKKLAEAVSAAKSAMEIVLATDGPTEGTRQTAKWFSASLRQLGRTTEADEIDKLVRK